MTNTAPRTVASVPGLMRLPSGERVPRPAVGDDVTRAGRSEVGTIRQIRNSEAAVVWAAGGESWHPIMRLRTVQQYVLPDDPGCPAFSLAAFERDNETIDEVELCAIRALLPGQSVTLGGGASGTYTIRRLP